MSQSTPIGGMLGYEAILTIKYQGERVDGYRWEIHKSGNLICSGTTDKRGSSNDLQIPMPFGNPQPYVIKVFGPVTFEDIQEWINGDTFGCNTPSEATMRAAVIKSIKEFLLEKLAKHKPVDGSTYSDNSYIDFSDMIRIDLPDKKKLRMTSTGPIHIGIRYNDKNEPVVKIYLTTGNMSYEFWSAKIDITAPNFGRLWEVFNKFLQDAIAETRTPLPPMDD
jgi:hypothetical protein